MTRRLLVPWRRPVRVFCVTAVASCLVPHVSAAQPSTPPVQAAPSVRASHFRQVPVDAYAMRWQVDLERTSYSLRCPPESATECTVDFPTIDLGAETARMINSEAGSDPALLRVCRDPTGSSCQPSVRWEPTARQQTDLAGHRLVCSGTYYLEWTLRTLRRAAVSNKLWLIAGSRDACPGTP